MTGKSFRLFKLLGFEVRADLSWIIIASLISWSLAEGVFPEHIRNLTPLTYWIMGMAGAIGLFLSVIVHEFAHSLVARHFGIPMKGITLFIFGGVAEMSDEPPNAFVEFLMALAGPLSSIAIGSIFTITYVIGSFAGLPVSVNGVIFYLAGINFLLAIFNLVPAFPLDGGRVLRAILWKLKNNYKEATRISSRIGYIFGVILMFLGIVQIFFNNLVGGIWWILIGIFVQNAAKMSYQQALLRRAFEGMPVKRFMTVNPVTVPPLISIAQLVTDYIYSYHFKMFPVVDEYGRLLGCISTKQVKEIPRDEWMVRKVIDALEKCSPQNAVEPETDAIKALAIMSQTGSNRLLVTKEGILLGVITLKDMLNFFSLRMELEGDK